MSPRGAANDLRYDFMGNEVSDRVDLHSGAQSGYDLINQIREAISSASYRIHPDIELPYESPTIIPWRSARCDSFRERSLDDPNGHLATVYATQPDGRIRDTYRPSRFSTVTRGFHYSQILCACLSWHGPASRIGGPSS